MRIRIDLIFHQIITKFDVCWSRRVDSKLPHSPNQSFRAIDEVLIYRGSIESKFIHGISLLMYNLHLLDNRRFSALPGSFMKVLAGCSIILPMCAAYPRARSCILVEVALSLPPTSYRFADYASSSPPVRSRSTCKLPSCFRLFGLQAQPRRLSIDYRRRNDCGQSCQNRFRVGGTIAITVDKGQCDNVEVVVNLATSWIPAERPCSSRLGDQIFPGSRNPNSRRIRLPNKL
jgi:hypothetical protein